MGVHELRNIESSTNTMQSVVCEVKSSKTNGVNIPESSFRVQLAWGSRKMEGFVSINMVFWGHNLAACRSTE